ncbi:unnamed protein product [Rodentolepis nana]|uniref:HCO3_cotransp domain-containing protein n=1 Tax=Rodentolepis nana TaxID=102285 RepID=A0A0R3T882_RODNA|nr:unnamed protein product [Rodentolepis nana]
MLGDAHEVEEAETKQNVVSSNDEALVETTNTMTTASDIFAVMRAVMSPGLCVFFTFFVSLSLAPSVFALIRPAHYDVNDPWTSTYFTPVIVFLLFAVCDFLGRMLGGRIRWVRHN